VGVANPSLGEQEAVGGDNTTTIYYITGLVSTYKYTIEQ